MEGFIETALTAFDVEVSKAYTILGNDPLMLKAATLIELKKQRRIDRKNPACNSIESAINSLIKIGDSEEEFANTFGTSNNGVEGEFEFDFSHDSVMAFSRHIRQSRKIIPLRLTNNVISQMISGPISFLASVSDEPVGLNFETGTRFYQTISICMVSLYGKNRLENLRICEEKLNLVGFTTSVATASHKAVKRYIEDGKDGDSFLEKLMELELELTKSLQVNKDNVNNINDVKRKFGSEYKLDTSKIILGSLIPRKRIIESPKGGTSVSIPNSNKRKNKGIESKLSEPSLDFTNGNNNDSAYLWINLGSNVQEVIRESVVKRGNNLDEFRKDKRTRIGLMVKAFEQIRIGGNLIHYVKPNGNGSGIYKKFDVDSSRFQIYVVGPTTKTRVLYTVDNSDGTHEVIAMISHQVYDQLLKKKGTER